MILTFGWPPKELSPNARSPGNWWNKSKAAAQYRYDCSILCRVAKLPKFDCEKLHLDIQFSPPDNRKRDLDGMLSSFKQGIDAISNVTGVDDSGFEFSIRKVEPVKGGKVTVEINPDWRAIRPAREAA